MSLTHYHGAHSYGTGLFVDAGAAVACSADGAAESRTKGQAGFDKNERRKPCRLEHPAVTFAETMVFDDGRRPVELARLGPAHRQAHAVAYLPREQILFAGDLCVNWKSGSNVAGRDARHPELDSRPRPAAWEVETLVPGHGALGASATLRAPAAYRDDMWAPVSAGEKAGQSAD